jgi:hypothetical protein
MSRINLRPSPVEKLYAAFEVESETLDGKTAFYVLGKKVDKQSDIFPTMTAMMQGRIAVAPQYHAILPG